MKDKLNPVGSNELFGGTCDVTIQRRSCLCLRLSFSAASVYRRSRRTPGITRRAFNVMTDKFSMRVALFAVGCMPLLGGATNATDNIISTGQAFQEADWQTQVREQLQQDYCIPQSDGY
jgi:hypothetical protein